MNHFSPFVKQLIVASSAQLAGLSVGGVIGYPNVIIEQFKANDSSIQVDMDVATWIGSIHGLAGIPSIFIPTLMQWRGRKIIFIITCVILCLGWFLMYFARSAVNVLIAEVFLGLGTNSIIVVSFYCISEMIDPKFRLISMSFYCVSESLGISMVGIIGRYLHWKIVAFVFSLPLFLALVIACFSPESPSWLAFKGEYEKCKKSFVWLRGSDERSCRELTALIKNQRELKHLEEKRRIGWKQIKNKIMRRDFYLPCFQAFVCLSLFYNSGTVVLVIYAMDMIRKITANESAAFYGMICIDIILFTGSFTTVFLLKYFNNKTVLLFSGFGTFVCLSCASVANFLQYDNVISKNSLLCLYCLICFIIVNSLGVTTTSFSVAAELMPVKHRDLGGSFYVILTCLMHFTCLKVSPYLFLHLNIWGTLLIYTINALCCSLYIWRYVPETKNRTLQEIEEFYNEGYFIDRLVMLDDDVDTKMLGEE